MKKPICKYEKCNNQTPYFNRQRGFQKYCCAECRYKSKLSPFKGKKLSQESRQKISKSRIGKYFGKDNPNYGNKYSEEIIKKIFETKLRNKTITSSKLEINLYNFLKQFYPTIKHHYRTKEYPFNCDYFIPELNLYIELQGSWTHGWKIYDSKNQDCIEQLKKWNQKSKNSKYYKNAINVWTIKDILKRETAKKNNLNYLEIFDYKDFNIILEQIKDYE